MQYIKYSSFHIFLTLCLLLTFNNVNGSLKLIRIITRIPKPKDIGLIFDVTLENSDEELKELLTFRIRASGYCSVNISPDIVMEKMGRIVGGNFGFIEPGKIEKVSLIWPTTSLYNRVGLCPIAITSTNVNNTEQTIKRMIKFDTRFEVLDPDNRTLTKEKNFIDCQNWDKDYMKHCNPVDCIERYFGLRNFYNKSSERCEDVPRCSKKYQLYDVFTNTCTDTRVILSDEDLNGFKESKFDNNVWEMKRNSNDIETMQNVSTADNKLLYDSNKHSYLQQANEEPLFKEKQISEKSEWLLGFGKGFLIIFVTIAIYLLICFSIFLFVMWLSRRSNHGRNTADSAIVVTPRHWGLSEENIPLYTSSSLISHR